MSPRQVADLGFKLMGIVAIIRSIDMLPDLFSAMAWNHEVAGLSSVNVPLLIAAQVVPFVLLVGGGLTLIIGSPAFARLMPSGSPEAANGITAADLHSIAFSSVGLILVGLAVSKAPLIIHNFAVLEASDNNKNGRFFEETWAWLLGTILQFGLGVFLIFKAPILVSLSRRRFDRATRAAADGRCPHCGSWFDSREDRAGAAVYLCGNCKQELPPGTVAPASGSSG